MLPSFALCNIVQFIPRLQILGLLLWFCGVLRRKAVQLTNCPLLCRYSGLLLLTLIIVCTRSISERERWRAVGTARQGTARYTIMACGGRFPLFSPCAPSRYATGQPKFVANGGLVPEVKAAGSCSLKRNCLEGLTQGSTRCETSSRYSDEEVAFSYGDPSSSTFAAGEKLVLDLAKSTSNGTLSMLDAFKAGSWAQQKPAAGAASAYMELISCSNQNLPLHSPGGQRALKATGINPSLLESSHEFKPDDASSHNMLSKSSGDLEILSESINECLMQEERANARPKEADHMQTAMKGSKRKAAELMKKPAGFEVQSERKSQEESRIVRVSRLTGGKDRHSKVRTAKGLRDRRVRLSVSTAIQFYDLQDRLGLEQPSLAVDWLLKAAQPFIAELPEPDTDSHSLSVSAPVVEAGSNLASTNCSPVKCRDSATATASPKTESKFSKKQLTIEPSKRSDAGKSSSSGSDGSIMGAEYTSKSSSLSKSARLKEARERFKRKSASAKIPAASAQANSLESSFPSQFMNGWSYKDEIPYGISSQVSGDHIQHQLWDCCTQLSYSDILCKDSRQLQHMGHLGTSSTVALQQAMQPGMWSSYEMADSGITYNDPKQRNAVQIYLNPITSYPSQQHQSQAMPKHFASTFVTAHGSDANFSTPGFCTNRGPLQSNPSSCITNYPPLHTQKNVYAEASTRLNVLPFHPYDARIPERFSSILDGNTQQ
ncbi:uncharacterized protein LOC131079127 [Cryptomeria japonica]|uniref:uncharacterized protein LOC131079127 n=1 Tax=Cryptomeria japonica TaxID=3369 RepID=UPI0025AD546B|nr:uncharacterized protein LOC131079127 [Cryptomeria japonica]XP_057872994.1 uncharacterized protein LOC131079127 [Cryptomeria japonica]XP_057872995.1 uncharacterized protein LOC131079127 [Cryptomeria japonica]XP_057872996.1 uncharacterized protein LOC131079127 [Cryptomeria japonica]